jgi:uncharacterized protein YggE
MAISITPGYRAAGVGVAAAALLIGAFSLGMNHGGTAGAGKSPVTLAAASQHAGRITVTGNGTVTGVPNQLTLSLSVQVNSYSVSSALAQANQTTRAVRAALTSRGVAGRDIQTSDLNISPNYSNNSQIPTSYAVSESLTATLTNLRTAGGQINAAVRAGGNAVSVNDVSLDLTSTGKLMAAARARAVADAKAQASQYAAALDEPLGPVISVTPVQQQVTQPEPFAMNSAAKGSASVPISAGTQQLTVSITVVYSA